MNDYKGIINTMDTASNQFDGVITKAEKALFDSAVELIKKLDIDANGNIKTTTANLKLLLSIKTKLERMTTHNKDYLKGVKDLANAFNGIYKQQVAFYSSHFAEKTLTDNAKSKLAAMQQIAVTNTIDGLTGAGLTQSVTGELSKMLLKAVTSGSKYADLVKGLHSFLMTDAQSHGALAKYAKTYATTALTQYAGQNNKLFTDDLGTEWFEYVGSEIETTREFCNALLQHHRYIHQSEIPDILKGHITDQQTGEVIEVKINPKTGLPQGMIDGTTPENFQVNVGGWNCRHQLVPIAKEAVPKPIRDKFEQTQQAQQQPPTPQPLQLTDEYQAALDKVQQYVDAHPKSKKIANQLAALKEGIANGNQGEFIALLTAATKLIDKYEYDAAWHKAQKEQIAQAKAQNTQYNAELQALSDLIPNADKWGQQFSLDELKAAHDAVQKKLAMWSTLPLDKQKQKLEFEIHYLTSNMSGVQQKYATWQVSQDAYTKALQEVEYKLAVEQIKQYELPQVKLWVSQHPKDTKLAKLLAGVENAINSGIALTTIQKQVADLLAEYQNCIDAQNKKKAEELAKMQTNLKTSTTTDEDFTQDRKDAAMWAKDTKTADAKLRKLCGDVWIAASYEERDAIYEYTRSYCNINEPLRGLQYYGSQASKDIGLKRIPYITEIISKSTYDFDMWVQRGDGLISLTSFGLSNYNTASRAEISALVGKTGVFAAFTSAGVAKGKGFSGGVIYNIYLPKGMQAMYAEPFSAYGHGAKSANWDGKSKQMTFGYESEILIQRGTKFRVTKVQWDAAGQLYIDIEAIEQKPLPFPYVGGYPY